MESFIGTKIINAKPMTRQAYNELRGWTVPTDENPADEGYLVEYRDGGQANHPDFKGYISWSPKEVFGRSYRPTSGMTFGLAIEAMKAGKRVARAGWNGKGMWLTVIDPDGWTVPNKNYVPNPEFDGEPHLKPWIAMKTADNGLVPWLASQTDMLAEDWTLVE